MDGDDDVNTKKRHVGTILNDRESHAFNIPLRQGIEVSNVLEYIIKLLLKQYCSKSTRCIIPLEPSVGFAMIERVASASHECKPLGLGGN